ncbi:MAG: glycoside hydrolase family 16 protein [Anaerolineales bacterium]|nr:glycoside hydrolase family 16 protein [Anaerolineales bacterium]
MPPRRHIPMHLYCAWGVLLLLSSACGPARSSASAPTVLPSHTPTPEGMRSGWDLTWHDEFEGGAIDPAHWVFDVGGGGWGNNEWEYYTDRPGNARVEGGMLILEARAEKYLHRNYTSARLKTQNLHAFTYGRIEARMRLPVGKGIWPAFWMLGADISQAGWPACGEIDIMEHIGREPNRVYGTVHGPGYSGGNGVGGFATAADGTLSDSFHTYAIEWEPGGIRWYLDDREYFRVDPGMVSGEWVYDFPFFLILNLAVGGDWPGYPDETTRFPQFLRVDYVRVYQLPGQAGRYQGPPGVLHLEEITLTAQENSDGTWQAAASIRVADADGLPVEGASVSGGWVGAVIRGETRGRSDASGYVRLLSDPVRRSGDVTFCVTGISHGGYTYDESANIRTCGKLER